MKKINFLVLAVFIVVSLVVGASFYLNSETTSAEPSDTILYDKYYKYTTNEINFFLKERGYDFVEEYDKKDVRIVKKELLVGLEPLTTEESYFHYEIYNGESLAIRGILYPEDEYYYSNLVANMGEFDKTISVKILNKNNELVYEFDVEEGE